MIMLLALRPLLVRMSNAVLGSLELSGVKAHSWYKRYLSPTYYQVGIDS